MTKSPQEICERIRELVPSLNGRTLDCRFTYAKEICFEHLIKAIPKPRRRGYGGETLYQYDFDKSFLQNLENEALRELLTKVLFEDNEKQA